MPTLKPKPQTLKHQESQYGKQTPVWVHGPLWPTKLSPSLLCKPVAEVSNFRLGIQGSGLRIAGWALGFGAYETVGGRVYDYPKAQNSPKALYRTDFGPNALQYEILELYRISMYLVP